jgi:hypothetical protein
VGRSGPSDSAGNVVWSSPQANLPPSISAIPQHIVRDVVFSINVDHVAFVMDSVALGQVSFALSVSFRCGIRTVKGNNKRQPRLNLYQF